MCWDILLRGKGKSLHLPSSTTKTEAQCLAGHLTFCKENIRPCTYHQMKLLPLFDYLHARHLSRKQVYHQILKLCEAQQHTKGKVVGGSVLWLQARKDVTDLGTKICN